MSDKTIEFINKAKKVHGDKYDYSKVNYINVKTKITVICKEHCEFNATPTNHINNKSGCPKCSGLYKPTTNEWIEKAKQIHSDNYDYSKVKYINSNTKIIIICKEHGEYEQTPDSHIRNAGCQKCSGNYIPTTNEWIEKAKQIHSDKYDYSKVKYINSKTKIIIICKEHCEFNQNPSDHLQGKGCIVCSNINNANLKRKTKTEFITNSIIIHGNKYDYSKVDYINNNTKIIIICKEHDEFNVTPTNHINNKSGCPKCSGHYIPTTNEWIEKAMEIHGDKYDYSKVIYKNGKNKIRIICKNHGEFIQSPDSHIFQKSGCPNCRPNYSKKQIEWLNFISKLKNINIQHALNQIEFTIPSTKYKADGYCKETNTIYEFHGDLWHGNPKLYKPSDISYFGIKYSELYKKTLEREQLIKDLGYNLVVIWEYDWNKINKSVKILQRKFRNSKLH